MTKFYSVRHNSFNNDGLPWIQSIVSGLEDGPTCTTCGVNLDYTSGDLQVLLEIKKVELWPDVLGCGAWSVLIVSGRVLEVWESHDVIVSSAGKVQIVPPYPANLAVDEAPAYFWINGESLLDARLNFDASGFVGVEFCPECRTRSDDIGATYDKQHSAVWPYVIVEETWGGRDLFTTDLSPSWYFCTRKLIDLASKYKLTNFRFAPADEGDRGSPIQYL
ncbi:MAG: hypothetical protein DWQ01_07670 [Planctomycetota bacterium]|nr:MAG: hypothetical protein DWQ01_07670 [Planctomycetota bacterium]